MAGIFDRIGGDDNVHGHDVTAAIVLGADGKFTNQNILDALNSPLKIPLDVAAQTDLVNIKAQLLAASGDGSKAIYMHRLTAAVTARESGQYNDEAGFRAYLGIT